MENEEKDEREERSGKPGKPRWHSYGPAALWPLPDRRKEDSDHQTREPFAGNGKLDENLTATYWG